MWSAFLSAEGRDEFKQGGACVLSHFSRVQLCDPMDGSPPGSSILGDSPDKNTGVGCHALLQGIFLTQGSKPHLSRLLRWQAGSLLVVPFGKPWSMTGTDRRYEGSVTEDRASPLCICQLWAVFWHWVHLSTTMGPAPWHFLSLGFSVLLSLLSLQV